MSNSSEKVCYDTGDTGFQIIAFLCFCLSFFEWFLLITKYFFSLGHGLRNTHSGYDARACVLRSWAAKSKKCSFYYHTSYDWYDISGGNAFNH